MGPTCESLVSSQDIDPNKLVKGCFIEQRLMSANQSKYNDGLTKYSLFSRLEPTCESLVSSQDVDLNKLVKRLLNRAEANECLSLLIRCLNS